MKTTVAIVMALFISLTVISSNKNFNQQESKKLNATYNGVTDDGTYKFTDAKSKIVYFDAVSDDINIDLYDEELIGKKFSITWEEEDVDEYDDEGEPTGKTVIYKTITELEVL